MKKSVTMSDIGKALNVSTVTVSKALSNKEGVSQSVREQIIEMAQQMGYVYTGSSKEDGKEKYYNIGILVPNHFMNETGNSFYWKVYQNITSSLKKHNSFGILELLDRNYKNHLPKIISGNKVDGIILLGQMDNEYIDVLYETGIPMILLDFYNQDAKYDSIINDSFYSAYMLTNHLINMGHKKIGFIGDIYATSSILDRYLGYCKSLIEHKIALRDEYTICDRDEDGLYIEFKLPEDMPTAFVCNCDEVAYVFINRLKEMGLNVPEDISIVGFDNYMLSNFISPALTTVSINDEEMAEVAVTSILNKITGDKKALGRRIVTSNIIYRDSVKDIR